VSAAKQVGYVEKGRVQTHSTIISADGGGIELLRNKTVDKGRVLGYQESGESAAAGTHV
jgi:hypothetical protein